MDTTTSAAFNCIHPVVHDTPVPIVKQVHSEKPAAYRRPQQVRRAKRNVEVKSVKLGSSMTVDIYFDHPPSRAACQPSSNVMGMFDTWDEIADICAKQGELISAIQTHVIQGDCKLTGRLGHIAAGRFVPCVTPTFFDTTKRSLTRRQWDTKHRCSRARARDVFHFVPEDKEGFDVMSTYSLTEPFMTTRTVKQKTVWSRAYHITATDLHSPTALLVEITQEIPILHAADDATRLGPQSVRTMTVETFNWHGWTYELVKEWSGTSIEQANVAKRSVRPQYQAVVSLESLIMTLAKPAVCTESAAMTAVRLQPSYILSTLMMYVQDMCQSAIKEVCHAVPRPLFRVHDGESCMCVKTAAIVPIDGGGVVRTCFDTIHPFHIL
jgi:hypothetical protein